VKKVYKILFYLNKTLFILVAYFFVSFFTVYWDFEIKMSDCISPFFDRNKKIEHYSNIPYYQLDLYDNGNLVDKKQLELAKSRFIEYIDIIKQNWYNSISLDDLNHLTIFKKDWFYRNTYLENRNKFYQKYFKELVKIARNNNIDVYITTDMQFYTNLLEEKIWEINSKNKNLENVNKHSLEELFEEIPEIAWVIIRIWEGWKAYNSWDYKSKIIYKTPEEVNKLLKSIIPIFEKKNKKLIFRTWTIWIWEVWDLITSEKTYSETFNWLESKNLIVSVKHTPWDFFRFEEINSIIWYWKLKQIVEIQIRKEYEWWWDFPNYIWDYYLNIINKIKDKKNVIWVWNWNQSWWWWWWNNILFNFWFNFYNELNFFSVWEILKNSKWDILENVLDKYNFNKDEKKIIYKILKSSREKIKKWFYINDYREKYIKIFWINIPPLNRIWWDKITTSPIILSLIYNSLDDKYKTIEESAFLLWEQKKEIELWNAFSRKNEFNQKITYSLENRYKIFEINHIFKKEFINYFENWERKYFYLLDKKIKEYNNFSENKNQFNFDFSEIYSFYWKDNLNIFYLYINLISFLFFLVAIIFHKKINTIYYENFRVNIFNTKLFFINVLILIITPFFFISSYNFYWIIIKISYLLFIFIITYFFVLRLFIKKELKQWEIKLRKSLEKIILLTSPIIIIWEIFIIFSYIFWEHIFWKLLTLWIFQKFIIYIIFLFFIFYFLFFIYYSIELTNLRKIIKKIKYKKSFYILSLISLIIFLLIILSLDFSKIFFQNIISNLMPSYFENAWSNMIEFF